MKLTIKTCRASLKAPLWSWCLVLSQSYPYSLRTEREHFWCLQKRSEQSHISAFGSPFLTACQSLWRRAAGFYFCCGLNSHLLTHTWDRRELEKKWHFTGWDKGSSIEQKIITMIKKYTKWGMCNQLLITHWRMCGHPWTVGCNPQPTPPALCAERGTIWCRMSLYPAEISCPGSGCVPSSLVTARAEKPLT